MPIRPPLHKPLHKIIQTGAAVHKPPGLKRKTTEKFYGSVDWKKLHEQTKECDAFRCVRCGSGGRLFVDHIKERKDGGSDTVENLETLCADCHNKRHGSAREKQ